MIRRVASIDALRGAIMIVMALDHVRDFIHRAAMSSSPTDLARTTPVLFFTRWVTHFCAPGFMFTAGLGAFLWLNTTKYPPSLAFLLMTLGPLLIALALFDRLRPASVRPLIVYGRVPLFYFMTHFYAAHLAAALLACVRYGSPAPQFMVGPIPSMGGSPKLFPLDFGYPLWVAYVVWALVVLGLYPACRRFARMKAAGHSWWLRYL